MREVKAKAMEVITFDFEVSCSALVPFCGSATCICAGCELPEDKGYLYISQKVVDRRVSKRRTRHEQSLPDYMKGVHRAIAVDVGIADAPVEVNERNDLPVKLCEDAANALDLNLTIAGRDLREWWQTGRVPLRATPMHDKVYSSYANSLPRVGREIVQADSIDLCRETAMKMYSNHQCIAEHCIEEADEFVDAGLGDTIEAARASMREVAEDIAIFVEEEITPFTSGVITGFSGENEEAVRDYLLQNRRNECWQKGVTLESLILSVDASINVFEVEIEKVVCVRKPMSILFGLFKILGKYDIHWKRQCSIHALYRTPCLVEFCFELDDKQALWKSHSREEYAMDLLENFDRSSIDKKWGSEAGAIFSQLRKSLNGERLLSFLDQHDFSHGRPDHSMTPGLKFESETGVLFANIRKDSGIVESVVYAAKKMQQAVCFASEQGRLTCRGI